MSNLFSIFDPNVLFFPINWISAIGVTLLLPALFWPQSNQQSTSISSLTKFVYGEFMAILGKTFSPGSTLVMLSLFSFIALNNFSDLFPYVFTATSHLSLTVALALPLWIGHMVMAWAFTSKNMLAHLVPLGTPLPLTPFMVLIEMISSIIRPLTLSVRLAANMVAGHLLLTLLSANSPHLSFSILLFPILGLILLSVLEVAVALIQAYVFSVLSTLYVNEVNSPKLN